MTFTLTPINVKKADGTSTPMIAYNDGTNNAFAHVLLDATGAPLSPATAGNQTTANSALATIVTQTNGLATAAAQTTANTSLASTATNTGNLDTSLGAKADAAASSDTGTFSLIALFKRALQSLTTIATAAQAATPAGANTIGTVGLVAGTAVVGKFATDQTTHGTTDLVAADITKVGGTALALGQAVAGSSIPVVLPAAQITSLAAPVLAAGAAVVGKVGIDQTTPGTTNAVQNIAAVRGGAKGATTAADITSTASGANHQAVDVVIYDTAGNPITSFGSAAGSVHLTAAPAVTAGAYTAGQVVGGLISLAGAARVNSGSGLVQAVAVTVKTALTAPYDVFFFDTNPTNSTFADNAPLAINVADLPSLCGVAHCTDLVSGGTPQILQATGLALPFKLSAAATTLYAVIVLRGAQTFASTSAVGLSVLAAQD